MNLAEAWEVVRRQWIAVVTILVIGMFAVLHFQLKSPDTYSGAARVLLLSQPGATDPSVSIGDLPVMATSTVVLERAIHALSFPVSLMQLKSHVSAKVVSHSNIMEISYRDPSKVRAIEVPNTVADTLSTVYGEISSDSYTHNVNNLTAALNLQSQKIAGLNRRLSAAVRNDPFVVSDRSPDDVTQRLDTLETDRALAESDAEADGALAGVSAPNTTLSKVARHEILEGDPRYHALNETAARDFAQLSVDRAGYTEKFPGLAGELAKVNGEQSAISNETRRALSDPNRFSLTESTTLVQHSKDLAIASGAKARVAKLDALIAQERSRLSDLPSTGIQVSSLRAELAAAQSEYDALSSRRAAALANRAEAFSLGTVQVLDRAINADTQIGSQRPMIVTVLSVFLVAIAIGAAFLIEALDPRILREKQIEALYGRPVVADLGNRT